MSRGIDVVKKSRKLVYCCEKCARDINEKTSVWLEMSLKGEWVIPGSAEWSNGPESQGCFPFGKDCANKVLEGMQGARS